MELKYKDYPEFYLSEPELDSTSKLISQIVEDYSDKHQKELLEYAIKMIDTHPFIVETPLESISYLNDVYSYSINLTCRLQACKTLEECQYVLPSVKRVFDFSKTNKEELIKVYEEKYGLSRNQNK